MNWYQVIKGRIRGAHLDHRAIARGMAWVSLFFILTSVVRAVKEIAIAYRYGVSAEVDAYLFVYNLVIWPVGVWFSVLTVVLVPLAARIRQGASAELPGFRSELFGFTLILALSLSFLGWLGLPLLLHASWVGLSVDTRVIADNMVPTLTMLAPLGVVISLFSAWMLAAGRHANTLLESVPSLTIFIVIIALPSNGSELLVWGTLAGFVFHLISLAVPLTQQGEVQMPRFSRQSSQWKPFWHGFGFMLVGQVLMSFTSIIDQFFAAHLGTGAIATLSYANRILTLIIGVGAMAVSRSTLTVFSQAQVQCGQQINYVASHWVRIMFVLGAVVMLVSLLLAPWGVKLLFERGEFTENETLIVTEVLRYGLVQLPFYLSSMVLISLLASQGKYRIIAIIAVANLFIKLATVIIFTPILGIKGIALSTSIMYATTLLLLSIGVKMEKK